MLHEVLPTARPPPSLVVVAVVLLLVLVVLLVPMPVVLPVTLLSMRMLLAPQAAPAPVNAKHSRTARWRGNLMADSRRTPAERVFGSAPGKKGPQPPFP